MKRDMDLIRELLLVIEAADHHRNLEQWSLNPFTHDVQYHIRLLLEGGLVRGIGETRDGAVSVRLTWQGCELLDLIRDADVWQRAKTFVQEKTHGLNVEVLHKVLTHWATETTNLEHWRIDSRLPAASRWNSQRVASNGGANVNGNTGNGNTGNGNTGNGNTGNGNRRPESVTTKPRTPREYIPARRTTQKTEAYNYLWSGRPDVETNWEGRATTIPLYLL